MTTIDAEIDAVNLPVENEKTDSNDAPYSSRGDLRLLPLSEIVPGLNPRRKFEMQAMKDLVESIRVMGLIQPITVRPAPRQLSPPTQEVLERYIIIAGERRYRAAKLAGIEDVPVHILHVSEVEALEMTLAENMEREDLDPIEEAIGIGELLERGRTQEQLAVTMKKSQEWIANRLRLLRLPPEVQSLISEKQIQTSAGVSLVSIREHPDKIKELARSAVENDWSIKEIDEAVRMFKVSLVPRVQPSIILDEAEVRDVSGGTPSEPDAEVQDDAEAEGEPEPAPYSGVKFVEPGPSPAAPVTVKAEQIVSKPDAASPKPETAAPAAPKAATPAPAPKAAPATRADYPSPPPPAPAKPSLPPGMMSSLVNQQDYEALQAEGMWPLSKIREALHKQQEGSPKEATPEPVKPTASMADKLMTATAITAALKLAEMNRTSGQVFTATETDLLDTLFPERETTTPAMVIAVLVESRRQRIVAAQEMALAGTRAIEDIEDREREEALAAKAADAFDGPSEDVDYGSEELPEMIIR